MTPSERRQAAIEKSAQQVKRQLRGALSPKRLYDIEREVLAALANLEEGAA